MNFEKAWETKWYPPKLDVFLNLWFSSYESARRELETNGGFLLPYEAHFFVCQAEAIRVLGLDPNDPDWELIGRDGARAEDPEAYERLCERRDWAT